MDEELPIIAATKKVHQGIADLASVAAECQVVATELSQLRISLDGAKHDDIVGSECNGTSVPMIAQDILAAKQLQLTGVLGRMVTTLVGLKGSVQEATQASNLKPAEPAAPHIEVINELRQEAGTPSSFELGPLGEEIERAMADATRPVQWGEGNPPVLIDGPRRYASDSGWQGSEAQAEARDAVAHSRTVRPAVRSVFSFGRREPQGA